jgi:hypothetical protein
MLRKKIFIIGCAISVFLLCGKASGESMPTTEYQVKAAFLYNFLKFIDWPPQKPTDSNDVFVIGVIGSQNPFGTAFDAVSKGLIRDRKLVVLRFEPFDKIVGLKQDSSDKYNQEIGSLRSCHLLFICSSEAPSIPQIFDAVSGAGVLTVSESPEFLEAGGAINFVLEKDKIVFEINLIPIQQANVEIRSQLLRIAIKVIGKAQGKMNN